MLTVSTTGCYKSHDLLALMYRTRELRHTLADSPSSGGRSEPTTKISYSILSPEGITPVSWWTVSCPGDHS